MKSKVEYLTTTAGPRLTFNVENVSSIEFAYLLVIEILVLWAGSAMSCFLIYVFNKSQIMHVNSYRIVVNLAIQYVFLYGLARLAEVCLLFYYFLFVQTSLSISEYHWIVTQDSPFFWTNVVRTYFIMVGAFTLPVIAAERVCANVWVSTYERNRRTYISWLLVPLVNVISVFFDYFYVTGVCKVHYLLCIICVANLAALFIFLYCGIISVRFYLKSISYVCASSRSNYSLSTRFQNIQNIRINKILRKLFVTSFSLNILLTIVFFLATFSNGSFTTYGNLCPLVILYQIKSFRRDLKYLLIRYHLPICFSRALCWSDEKLSKKNNAVTCLLNSQALQLENVLGKKLVHLSTEHQTDAYFSQLHEIWQQRPPKHAENGHLAAEYSGQRSSKVLFTRKQTK